MQILNKGSCREMWMIICLLEVCKNSIFLKRKTPKCVDNWGIIPQNLWEVNVWTLASAPALWLSLIRYMFGLYCFSFKIWLDRPTTRVQIIMSELWALTMFLMISERFRGCCFCCCCVSSVKMSYRIWGNVFIKQSFHFALTCCTICTEYIFSSSFSPSNNIQDQYLIISDIYGVRERARGWKN